MKKFIILAIGLVLSFQVKAQVGFSTYGSGGTAINAGTNYTIISEYSKNSGEPSVTYINATTVFGSGTTALTSYISTNSTTATATNLLTTTNTVVSTNGFAAGQWVVIQHVQSNPRFRNEACIISAVQNTNQIVTATAPIYPVAVGDKLYPEIAWETIPFVTSTTAREISNANGILAGQRQTPFLLTLVGSAAGTNNINAVTATYVP